VGSGFTGHRNVDVVRDFMVQQLGFKTTEEAGALRDKYFEQYHSTMKALIMASEEGALPDGASFEQASLVRADHALTPIVPANPARLSVSLLPWSSSMCSLTMQPCAASPPLSCLQGEYWAANCDFEAYLTPEPPFITALEELEALGLKLCIFTNGPRAYGLKVLEKLQVKRFFADERIFAVEDVLVFNSSFKPVHHTAFC
jgi:hypothetical protein